MASVVYYKNSKTGRTYAYEVEAHWDSAKGYSVPKRKYLGRVDPVTNEVIPTTGKPGRPSGRKNKAANNQKDNQEVETVENELAKANAVILEMKQEIESLRRENQKMKAVLQRMRDELETLVL